jgi:hypothetical protein
MILNLAAEFNVREASVRVSPWMVSDRVANDANRLDFAWVFRNEQGIFPPG